MNISFVSIGRKITALVVVALFFSLASEAASIKGMLSGSADGKYIYIFKQFGFESTKFDSVKVAGGEFKFERANAWPRGLYRLGFGDPNSDLTLVLCNEDIEVEGSDKNLAQAHVKNSRENDAWQSFQNFKADANKKLGALQGQAQQLEGLRKAEPVKFEQQLNALKAKFDSVIKTLDVLNTNFAENHPKLFIGKVASIFIITPKTSRANYFKVTDFTDEELQRSNVIIDKLTTFFQKFVTENLDDYKKAAEEVIKLTPANSAGRELALGSVVQLFSQFEPGMAYQFAKRYTEEFPKSARGAKLMALMPLPAPEVGDMAPDIKLADKNGKMVALSTLKGQVVLIDFWASWCGPCRMENPNVVRAYNKYKSKGFTVFSVSLDNNKEKWLAAIDKDGLIWPNHISDLKGWQSEGAKLYKVNSIPATFLVDKDGKVIGKNLRGPDLEEKLEKVLNNN